MTATEFNTYNDYVKARAAQGLQVIPGFLWKALKENDPSLITKPIMNPVRT